MFLLNINGNTNPKHIEKIFSSIDHFKLIYNFTIMYTPNLGKSLKYKELLIDKNFYHALKIDLNKIDNYSEEELEDFILDLEQLDSNILLKEYVGENETLKKLLKDILDNFKLEYISDKPFDFDKEMDLTDLTYEEYMVILEIMQDDDLEKKYYSSQFLFEIRVDEDGSVYKNDKFIFNLDESEFHELFIHIKKRDLNIMTRDYVDYHTDNILDASWYSPFIFLSNADDKNLNKKIINYKYKIFDIMKNIDPIDYPLINTEVITILNNNGYIKFNEIIDIIKE